MRKKSAPTGPTPSENSIALAVREWEKRHEEEDASLYIIRAAHNIGMTFF